MITPIICSTAFIIAPHHIGALVSFPLNWSSLTRGHHVCLYSLASRIVRGWCLPHNTHWMKKLTSRAASHQPGGFGPMKCMWSHEPQCSPMQALSNAKVLCCGWLPDPREPGKDTVYNTDIHTYLIDTLTQSYLGNKIPSTDQQARSLKKVLGDWEPG